jgi:hypothetical protein
MIACMAHRICLHLAYALFLVSGAARAADDNVRDKAPIVMESYVVDARKTEVLFKGTDISVCLDKDVYPVRDVNGSAWVVAIGGEDRTISAKHAAVNLKVTSSLKLTDISANIVGFSKLPGYSFANDPTVIQSKAMMRAAMTTAMLQGVAQDAQDLADTVGNVALGPSATFAAGDHQFGDMALLHTAQTTPAITHPVKAQAGSTSTYNPLVITTMNGADGNGLAELEDIHAAKVAEAQTKSSMEPLGRLTTMGFDAVIIDFSVSAAKPLQSPYLVTIARFHDTSAPPGTEQKLIFAKALNPIDTQTSHVHFSEEGFPFNYEMIDFQVHLYNRGVEIPTNLSPDRSDMTREEAFQFIKAEYVAAHKGDTRPPSPAMGKLPATLPTRLAAGDYGQTFYVRVSRDGLADAAFADGSCSKRIEDPFLESVVRSLRFKPALANGEPAIGVAALNLSKLQI